MPVVRRRSLLSALPLLAMPVACWAALPAFDCRQARGSVQAMICRDEALGALDRRLFHTYEDARRHAPDDRRRALHAEQRDWLKERDACWKADHQRDCIVSAYTHRIAGLQATWRLAPVAGTARYACDAAGTDIVTATYFKTDPATLVATRHGNQTVLMFVAPSGSGARYEGAGDMALWEHQGNARIRWGPGADEVECPLR